MFVIIKKGQIVKSKSSKTNQGPHLVLIYYKLILFSNRNVSDERENFQTEEADESYRLIIQSDAVKTECTNNVLSWLFTNSNQSDADETRKGSKT